MFERLTYLINNETLNKISNINILLVGVGGVGGAFLEAATRLGIKHITIIDNDTFEISNLNRQILSNHSNIGHSKVIEASLRAKSINPETDIISKEMFLDASNIDEIDYTKYDYIVDCCDTVTTKLLLIKKSIKHNIKIITSMGTGNRLDPTKLTITDIWHTNYDPLAKIMRQLLRKNNIYDKIPVVTSTEIPIKIKSHKPGSTSLVPNVAGFYIAYYIFNDIIKQGSDFDE